MTPIGEPLPPDITVPPVAERTGRVIPLRDRPDQPVKRPQA
ncbi:hypothetical protein [Actinoplanes derwentensis]|nr:hypothetical protein [Actinoplanes derwentensis]